MQQTLATVASCLKPGGVCLATVVDYRALAQLASAASKSSPSLPTAPSDDASAAAAAANGVSFGNGAFEVSLTTGAAAQLQALVQEYDNNKHDQGDASAATNAEGTEPWGIEYLFSLGDAVQVRQVFETSMCEK